MIAERILEPLQRAFAEHGNGALHWYAVIDAAQPLPALARTRHARLPCKTLYEGQLAALADKAAPHLVGLELEHDHAAWLLAHGSQHWGILLQSSANFDTVRQHLRKLLVVEDPEGKQRRFRFFDPRILRAFLPVCTVEEASTFFGPVQRFYTVARDPRNWLSFSANSHGVQQERLG